MVSPLHICLWYLILWHDTLHNEVWILSLEELSSNKEVLSHVFDSNAMKDHVNARNWSKFWYGIEYIIDSSPHGQNGSNFTDDICRYIFVNERFYILIETSLEFVPNGSKDNILALI